MNANWKTVLLSQTSLEGNVATDNTRTFTALKQPCIYPLTHLGSLTVSGKDAAKLLQGQLTCNINEISESKSVFAAMCNPKGRVIATFLLLKKADTFILLLPSEMLESVQKRLQMYVLRADVKISDSTDNLCLLGSSEPGQPCQPFSTVISNGLIKINLPGNLSRKLLITDADLGLRYWSEQSVLQNQGSYQPSTIEAWRYSDMLSGLPWVTTVTSEEFIPQMLNVDQLGGVSFNKGCYTGQEIVARTHYLGKAKRELVLAECEFSSAPELMANVVNLDSSEDEVVGKVFMAQQTPQGCVLQVVLQTIDGTYNNLGIENNGQQQPIKLIP